METDYQLRLLLHAVCKLRENHSGMETVFILHPSFFHPPCCVRTIVVWKLMVLGMVYANPFVLRENHSGMETGFI